MFTFTSFVDALLKARGHKYIKRIPYMSRGKKRYRYIYKVTHTHRGRQAFDSEHLDVGTAFALHTEAGAEFHGHITKVQGDQVTYRIDDGERKGELVTVSKSELLNQLNDVHGIESKLNAERDKLRSQIEVAKEKGSEKQVRRLEERLARLGGEEKRAEPEPEPESEESVVSADFNVEAIQDAIDNGKELSPFIELRNQFIEKRNAGVLSPAVLQESLRLFETMLADLLTTRIKKKKKDILISYIASNINMMTAINLKRSKKSDAVDEIMAYFLRSVTDTPLLRQRRATQTFDIFSSAPRESYADKIKRLVGEYTEEDATRDRELLETEIAEARAKQAEKERVLAEPKSARDFAELKRLRERKGESLTDEEAVKHNDLIARETRERRESEKQTAEPQKTVAGGFESFDTKHSKTGKDLYAVRPETRVDRAEYQRLRDEAKKLGGYYSSYRTVRGFVFPTPEARAQFIQQNSAEGERPTPTPIDRQATKRDALRERLDGYRKKANDEVNADRRTNTARRAQQARYAVADAMRRIEHANKGARVLNAIDEGRAYHLKNISTVADLDMFASIVARAKSDEASRVSQESRATSSPKDYDKVWSELVNAPITQSVIERGTYYPNKLKLWPSDIKTLISFLTRSDGTARRGARYALSTLNTLLQSPKEQAHTVKLDTLMSVLSHVPPEADRSFGVLHRVTELKRDHDRMVRLGINTETELKATLREYEDIVHERSAEEEQAHREAISAKEDRDRLIRRGEFARMNIPSYFPTPKPVISRMIELAGIHEGETVLEPSAGAGHIIEALQETQGRVSAVEANYTLREYLEEQGHNVVGNDALAHVDKYDHVIMNPPFEKQADIDHVTHAFNNNLVEGGKLVAVMSASAMSRDNAKARAFQEIVNQYGHYEQLPEGSFKDSDRATGVNTVLVVLDHPVHGLNKSLSFSSIVDSLLRW